MTASHLILDLPLVMSRRTTMRCAQLPKQRPLIITPAPSHPLASALATASPLFFTLITCICMCMLTALITSLSVCAGILWLRNQPIFVRSRDAGGTIDFSSICLLATNQRSVAKSSLAPSLGARTFVPHLPECATLAGWSRTRVELSWLG